MGMNSFNEEKISRRKFLEGAGTLAAAVVLGPASTDSISPIGTPESSPSSERVKNMEALIAGAHRILELKGRDEAKLLLPTIYDTFQALNGASGAIEWIWSKDGSLTEEEFNRLSRAGKVLSNAIGIMTANGVRHDLNVI